MCGRYASSRDAAALVETLTDLGIAVGRVDEDAGEVAPSFNVAPTQRRLVLARDGRGDDEEVRARAGTGVRVAGLSWGLVPSWSRDRRGAARMINARVESVPERSAYRGLLANRRCLVPMDGWFEWRAAQAAGGPGKQPYFVSAAGERSLLLAAGLYTWWRDPAGTPDPDTGRVPWFGSYTILTAPARDDLGWLHDRMPLVVLPSRWHDWLGVPSPAEETGTAAVEPGPVSDAAREPAGTPPDPRSLLDALRSDLARPPQLPLAWHPVDRRVGSVANDDPSLVAPLDGPADTRGVTERD